MGLSMPQFGGHALADLEKHIGGARLAVGPVDEVHRAPGVVEALRCRPQLGSGVD
jgi:hypothetical protein